MDLQILTLRFYEYAKTFNGYTKDTIRRYESVLEFFMSQAQVSELEHVTPETVRSFFFLGRTQRGWSSQTFCTYHKTLMAFFKWCVRQGYRIDNPAQSIEPPKIEKRLPKKLTKQQAFYLLEVTENYPYRLPFARFRNHAMFATFIYAGLRKQELLNLKFGDVDLENLTLYVRQGKGSKDRMIPIPHALADILKRYIAQRQRFKRTCPNLFTGLRANIPFGYHGLRLLVRAIRNASGIKFNVHMLRHTFATLMLEGGCDIYSLSRMMGHSDIKTTTIYLSATVEHLRGQINKHPLNNHN